MNSAGEQEPSQIQHEPAGAMLSQAMSLSSQPSLPSLPSLGHRDQNVIPSLHQCLATLRAHSYVSALAVDGDSLYSASSDGRIRVWPLDGRASEGQSSGRMTTVAALQSSPRATAPSHQDGKIRAWRAGSLKDGSRRLAPRAVVCSGSADRTVRVWRRRTENTGYTCLAVLEGHGAPVTAVRSVALVCSGALDGEVKIWSVLVPCLLER
uniref:Uncharacterized protein n=1 Tax=Setaria viridis TaxID=4556 RepID=A0A4U6UAQ7_SETVI|nr:hypothetical protein SEVIR_6G256000v2 [Setaria viridis]